MSLTCIFPDKTIGSYKFVLVKDNKSNYFIIAQDVDYHAYIDIRLISGGVVMGGGIMDIIHNNICLKGKSDQYGCIIYNDQLIQSIKSALKNYKVIIQPDNPVDDTTNVIGSLIEQLGL